MSVTTSESYRNPFQWRNDSGELDVFEAARYFSGVNENPAAKYDHYFIRNGARMSLDMTKRSSIPKEDHCLEKQIKENKKCKQPSSPGARLASFLNSLFNQKSLKKKKKPKSSGKFNDLEEEIPGGLRRKRRSSLGHFPATIVPNSGHYFRPGTLKNEAYNEKRRADYAWIDDKFSFRNGISETTSKHGSSFKFTGHTKQFDTTWGLHDYLSELREIREFSDADDHGAESDSSSDLFDLPNCGSNFCSRTGLPVYETTQLDLAN